MHKIVVIAKREYFANVRTKAFIISLVLMPLMMLGGIFIPQALEGRVDIEDQKVVVLDRTGKVFTALVAAAERRNQHEIYDLDKKRQTDPRFILVQGPDKPIDDELRFDLSQRIRKREIHAFVEIDPAVLDAPEKAAATPCVHFHSESVISNSVSRWLQRVLTQHVHGERLRAAGLDAGLVQRATAPVFMDNLGLLSRSTTGEITQAKEGSRGAALFAPMVIMMLMFMTIMMSQTLMQTALEEKQQRIAEVLLGSATPFEMMMGKLLGNVGVSLTVVSLYLAGGFWLLRHNGYSDLVPSTVVAWFLVYQVFGVLLFGSVFIAIGASCTELKEAQNYLMPVMLILILPMMVWFKVLEEPMSRFATVLSLFPPCTPMLMVLRMSVTQAVPLWQPLLGVVLVLLAMLACVFAAARIYRIGILSQGKAPKMSELARWVISG